MVPRAPVGDSHNFGRRVTVRANRVAKPRAILWEWLVLCADSPLRALLRDASHEDDIGPGAFDFLPDLRFFPSRTEAGGEVQRVALEPLPRSSAASRRDLARVVGRALALFSWLGVSDLHWENLVVGLDPRGRVVFAPLDVEMILADLSLPTETKLLPDADPEYADLCRHASGVRRVLPYLGKPVAAVFAELPRLRETPIRVCLRSTGDYVRARSEPIWPPLLDEESEQLARGDIPYFFRLYGQPGIHYYADASLRRTGRLPLHGDVPRLDPILQLSRGLRAPSRKKLREEGLLTVIGAFDDPSLTGAYAADGLTVLFKPRSLVVTLPSGEELHTRRDLRAFVGSVYLTCRCGEVRAVFVPPVTVCEASKVD